jgi:diguanylate cyclase (GGDEF)-like protein/PAS domain S-box-containing protein
MRRTRADCTYEGSASDPKSSSREPTKWPARERQGPSLHSVGVDGRDRFSQVFELCPVGLALTAERGLIVQANPALAALLGCDAPSLAGRRLLEFTHPDDRAESDHAGQRVLRGDQDRVSLTKRYVRADGEPIDVRVTMLALDDPDGQARKLVQVEDLTSQLARETSLQRELERDPLTGLSNRRGLERQLVALAAREARPDDTRATPGGGLAVGERGPGWAVLYVDLDRFKEINDRYGHHMGDRVLSVVGQILQTGTRDGDLVARVGGDEFVVVLRVAGEADVQRGVARLRASLDRPLRVGDETVRVHPSVGAAAAHPGDSLAEVLERADREMYRSKRTGR